MYRFYDGECFITFDLLGATENFVIVVVSKQGKVSRQEFDLRKDENGFYFEYGIDCKKIYLDEFQGE